jgi:hypothetical protein
LPPSRTHDPRGDEILPSGDPVTLARVDRTGTALRRARKPPSLLSSRDVSQLCEQWNVPLAMFDHAHTAIALSVYPR